MKSINLIFEEARRQLEIQIGSIGSIDSKIGMIIGFNGVILGIAFSMDRSLISILWLYKIGIFLLFISFLAGIRAFWFRKYNMDPDPGALVKYYLKEEELFTKKRLIANYVNSYAMNKKILNGKINAAKISFIILFFGILSISICSF